MATAIDMSHEVKQTIGEIDVVAFTEAIDKDEGTGKWPAGTEGTVVHAFGDHKMVEISDDRGVMLDLPVVAVEKLKLVQKYSRSGADGITPPRADRGRARGCSARPDRPAR